jgi:pimeloyl-ACP methyl ester carboxylesterase
MSDSFDPQNMEIRTPDGVELSFDIAGTDSPPFLFVHGGGADRSHLAPQFDFFSQRNRSINLDLRGYGKSGRSEKYGTIEQYAEDLADLCNQLNIQKAIIIGHSMGGMVAVEFAAKYPSLSTAAVLISSGVLFPRAALADEANVLEGLRSPAYKDALCGLINQICLPSDRCKTYAKESFLAVPQQQWIAHFETMFAWNDKAVDRLKACKLPILYIEDDGGRYSDLALFSEVCPQLVVGKVVGSGHFPTLEVPDQVNAMIQRFIAVYVKL